MAKFSGATGNFHTLELVDNKTNWINATKKFINQYQELFQGKVHLIDHIDKPRIVHG
jgi:hypothetical protein